MDRLYVFLIRNDVWIYIICGLGLLWYLNELIRSHSRARRAMFGLERETALRSRNNALLFVIILSTIAAAVAYVNSEIRPTLPPDLLLPPTPTVGAGLAATIPPTSATGLAPQGTASPTSPIAPTVTISAQSSSPLTSTLPLTPTLDLTVTAPAPTSTGQESNSNPTAEPTSATQPSGCSPDAIITEPRENATVLGLLNVFGSANTGDFAYYEIEILGPQTNVRWASLVGRRVMQPVVDGILAGNVNLSTWAAGEYDIRLSITNEEEQVTHRCLVSIILRTTVPGADQ